MKADDRQILIDYRLEQAQRTLEQARILAREEQWDGVVNRAYYAMFYAALALLLTKGLGSSKHSGVLSLVDREFVKPGIVHRNVSMMLRDAFNQRQKSDYSELIPTSESRAREILKNAERCIEQLSATIISLKQM